MRKSTAMIRRFTASCAPSDAAMDAKLRFEPSNPCNSKTGGAVLSLKPNSVVCNCTDCVVVVVVVVVVDDTVVILMAEWDNVLPILRCAHLVLVIVGEKACTAACCRMASVAIAHKTTSMQRLRTILGILQIYLVVTVYI